MVTDLMPVNDKRADLVRRITGVEGSRADGPRVGGPARLRPDPAVGAPGAPGRPGADRRRRRTRQAGAARSAAPRGRRRSAPRRVRGQRGRRADLLHHLGALAPAGAAAAGVRRPDPGDDRRAPGLGRRLRVRRAVAHRGGAQPGHPARAHPRRDRRHRGRTDDEPPRGVRRRAQLGLPVLLAARRRPDPRRPAGGAAARESAKLWRGWLLRAVAGDPEDLQIMYTVDGGRHLPERVLDHLAGYAGQPPGADRQRRRRAAPDRRARRGDGRPRSGPGAPASRRPRTAGRCSAPWSTSSPTTGTSRTTGCGRSAGRAAASPTAG